MIREQDPTIRQANRIKAMRNLDEENITYERKNHGAHLIIANRWDLWPGTGKWRDRKINKHSHGLSNLIKLIKETK